MLLFSIAIDVHIKEMLSQLPGDGFHLRVYADDLGMVLKNLAEQLPILMRCFDLFAAVSAVCLKPSKCVLVPLAKDADFQAIRAMLAAIRPLLAHFNVATWAIYLGMALGPGADDNGWLAPVRKCMRRTMEVRALGLGLTLSMY